MVKMRITGLEMKGKIKALINKVFSRNKKIILKLGMKDENPMLS